MTAELATVAPVWMTVGQALAGQRRDQVDLPISGDHTTRAEAARATWPQAHTTARA